LILYRFSVSGHISFYFLSASSVITALRYFAGYTIWYIIILTFLALCIFSLILTVLVPLLFLFSLV
jgi:hypothetical protein